MPRVTVDLPASYHFATDIPIQIGHINYGGHLGNDSVLSLVHEARVRFFAHHGWTELNAGGAGIIMIDAAIVYRAEATWGMTLRAELAVTDVGSRGCEIVTRLSDAAGGREIARVKTGIVFFDYAARRIVSTPDAFRAAFK